MAHFLEILLGFSKNGVVLVHNYTNNICNLRQSNRVENIWEGRHCWFKKNSKMAAILNLYHGSHDLICIK